MSSDELYILREFIIIHHDFILVGVLRQGGARGPQGHGQRSELQQQLQERGGWDRRFVSCDVLVWFNFVC